MLLVLLAIAVGLEGITVEAQNDDSSSLQKLCQAAKEACGLNEAETTTTSTAPMTNATTVGTTNCPTKPTERPIKGRFCYNDDNCGKNYCCVGANSLPYHQRCTDYGQDGDACDQDNSKNKDGIYNSIYCPCDRGLSCVQPTEEDKKRYANSGHYYRDHTRCH